MLTYRVGPKGLNQYPLTLPLQQLRTCRLSSHGEIDPVTLLPIRCLRRGLAIGDALQLLQEFVGHEGNGWEVVDDGLEDCNRVPYVHPLHAPKAGSQGSVQVPMPTKQEIPEWVVFDKRLGLSLLVKFSRESRIVPACGYSSFGLAKGFFLIQRFVGMPS